MRRRIAHPATLPPVVGHEQDDDHGVPGGKAGRQEEAEIGRERRVHTQKGQRDAAKEGKVDANGGHERLQCRSPIVFIAYLFVFHEYILVKKMTHS